MAESYLERLQKFCDGYMEEMADLAVKRRPTQGMFGFGKRLSDEPCNETFLHDVQSFFQTLEEEAPDSGEIRRILEYLYLYPTHHSKPEAAYWMLQAVQSFTIPLLARLSPDDARQVLLLFERTYPRRGRLPAQVKIAAALTEAANR